MSYAERNLRKSRRAKTGRELRHLIARDTRWAIRHGIAEEDAHQWDRHPDHTIQEVPHDRTELG